MIHLITTMNRPCLHFELNEAWILDTDSVQEQFSDAELMKNTSSSFVKIHEYEEKYPNGHTKIKFSGGVADNGRFLLDGSETWYYENGTIQREANYKLGRKVGTETYWDTDGIKLWQWQHKDDGSSLWTRYWPNGKNRTESTWNNFKCEGTATVWDRNGLVISRTVFVNGRDSAGTGDNDDNSD